jgi:hypothetical protein
MTDVSFHHREILRSSDAGLVFDDETRDCLYVFRFPFLSMFRFDMDLDSQMTDKDYPQALSSK